jgi:hypothetical protein
MPIAVSCTCGKHFNVKDDLAGKKIKCPGCQAVVQVPDAGAPTVGVQEPQPVKAEVIEDEPVAAKIVPKAATVVEDDFDDEPRRGGKKKKKKSDKQGSKTLLFVLLGGGVLLLGLCCIGGGIGGYFLFLAGPGDPDKVIVGKWQYDSVVGSGITVGSTGYTLEFKADGTFNKTFLLGGFGDVRNGKWKSYGKKGNSITVDWSYEIVQPGFRTTLTETVDFTFTSNNVMEMKQNRNDTYGIRFKRI